MRLPTIIIRGDILASWLTVSDYTRSRLADELGVSKGRISQLLNSHEEPSAHLIAKLMQLTRLPFDRLFRVITEHPAASAGAAGSATTHRSSLEAPTRAHRRTRAVLVQ